MANDEAAKIIEIFNYRRAAYLRMSGVECTAIPGMNRRLKFFTMDTPAARKAIDDFDHNALLQDFIQAEKSIMQELQLLKRAFFDNGLGVSTGISDDVNTSPGPHGNREEAESL